MECALCKASLASQEELEAHIREELDYARWRCRYCLVSFFSYAQAKTHFEPVVRSHPGRAPSIAESVKMGLERRLQELLQKSAQEPLLKAKQEMGREEEPDIVEVKEEPPPPAIQMEAGNSSTPSTAPMLSDQCAPLASPEARPAAPKATLKVLSKAECAKEEEAEESPAADEKAPEDTEDPDQTLNETFDLSQEQELVPVNPDAGEQPEDAAADRHMDDDAGADGEQKDIASEKSKAECQLCGKLVMRHYKARKAHLAARHLDESFRCGHCGKVFRQVSRSETASRMHQLRHHPRLAMALEDRRPPLSVRQELLQRAFPNIYPSSLHRPAFQGDQKGQRENDAIKETLGADPKAYLACAKCGEEVRKNNARDHALSKHSREAFFRCALCEFASTRRPGPVRDHIKDKHPDAENPGALLLDRKAELKDRIQQLTEEAFPSLSSVVTAPPVAQGRPEMQEQTDASDAQKALESNRAFCKLCSSDVSSAHKPLHIIRKHLGENTFKCTKCGHGFRALSQKDGTIKDHFRFKHSGAEVELEDQRAELQPRIKTLYDQAFGPDLPQGGVSSPRASQDPNPRCEMIPATKLKHSEEMDEKSGLSASEKEPLACRRCGDTIQHSNQSRHVAYKHNEEPLFACRVCRFATKNNVPSQIRAHMAAKHPQRKEDFEDRRQALKEHLADLLRQCFP